MASDPQKLLRAPGIYRKHLEPMRVLVVDDDPEILEVVAFVLDAAGFRILQASSGEECVRVAIAEQPEIILMDKQMPGMDGKAAAALLAGHIETRNIPILMMTDGIEDGDRIAALATEGVDLLTKPLSMSEVVAKVVSIARRKAYRDEAQTGRKELLAGVTTQTHQLQSALEAFSRFVPGEFLRLLSKKNILDVALGDQIQTEMAILFADIRSFTAMSEQMSPREIFAFLNAYFGRMNPFIWENGGYIDKYIGDAIMAHFPSGAGAGVDAAIAMLNQITVYNTDRARYGYGPIRIGIGVHAGPVMLGIIGDERFMQGTVISDAVNLASRLEELTKVYGVSLIVSAQSIAELQDPNRYKYRFLDRVQPKGKTESVPIYEVFDADPSEVAERKMRIREEFEQGAFEYHAGRINVAAELFEGISARGEMDRPTEIYRERCARSLGSGHPVTAGIGNEDEGA